MINYDEQKKALDKEYSSKRNELDRLHREQQTSLISDEVKEVGNFIA